MSSATPVHRVGAGDPDKRRGQQDGNRRKPPGEAAHDSPHDKVELHEGAAEVQPVNDVAASAPKEINPEEPREGEPRHIDVQA